MSRCGRGQREAFHSPAEPAYVIGKTFNALPSDRAILAGSGSLTAHRQHDEPLSHRRRMINISRTCAQGSETA